MADLASRITEPPADAPAEAAAPAESKPVEGQLDGTVEALGGSGLIENTYDVDVKLGDLQSDQNSTLYSAKTFADMGLYVILLEQFSTQMLTDCCKVPSRFTVVCLP